MSDSKGANTLRGRTVLRIARNGPQRRFPAGKRLEEFDLSRRLGVSRPVLRSALDHLASEGLLEPLPSGGYAARHLRWRTSGTSSWRVRRWKRWRLVLRPSESRILRNLSRARKLNAELAEAIPSHASDPPTPEEMSRFGDLNAAFHSAIRRLARSPMLSLVPPASSIGGVRISGGRCDSRGRRWCTACI